MKFYHEDYHNTKNVIDATGKVLYTKRAYQ